MLHLNAAEELVNQKGTKRGGKKKVAPAGM